MKKKLSLILCITLLFTYATAPAAKQTEILTDKTVSYILTTVTAPYPGAAGGEWSVLALSRSDKQISREYYNIYLKNASDLLKSKNGVLHKRKYTEYSKMILALTSLCENPTSFAGYNIVSPLYDFDKTVSQGLNGAIWALIALDSNNYATEEIRIKYRDYIVSKHITNSGFSLTDNSTADVDITAMAICALAPYKNDEKIKKVIDSSLTFLSENQNENGAFSSYEGENCESCAQVLTALCSLSLSPYDPRFVKNENSVIDALCAFMNDDGSFSHIKGDKPNLMATEQALYSLVALSRLNCGLSSFFDMKTASEISPPVISLPSKNGTVKHFSDVQNIPQKDAIETLSSYLIINGMTDTLFSPDTTMTRAQFATIIVKALSLPQKEVSVFADVNKSDWYFQYVSSAYYYKIVNGISPTLFSPNGTISREEAAVMICRACALCKMNTVLSLNDSIDALNSFTDSGDISDWAKNQYAFCIKNNIFKAENNKLNPKQKITRAEVAQAIYNMLREAKML